MLLRELRAAREPLRLVLAYKALSRSPKGTAGVMVIPGYSTNDAAMTPLRTFLTGRGHRVWGWGLRTNRGDVAGMLDAVVDQVAMRVMANGGEPIALVGWSLGGVFAREVARDRPDLVSQIITMATPIYGGPRYTVSARNYSHEAITEIEATIAERNTRLIEHEITAFYSKLDGALDWRTCIDDLNPNVEMIEIDSSHLGITLDPVVWTKIAQRLAPQKRR